MQRLYGGDFARMVAAGKIPDPEASLKRLKKQGFSPATIFDVGAYQGDFSDMCLKVWPESSIHAFEALPEKMPKLQNRFSDKKVKITNALVGDQNTDDIQFYADETASSILESYELHPKRKLNLKMITLDGYVEQGMPLPDLLKIDTQGYEYPILKGFEKNIGRIPVLLLELNVIEIYYQVTLAQDVIHFLSQFGFVIYDICEIHRRPLDNALVNLDFVFVKKDSFLREDKRWDKAES